MRHTERMAKHFKELHYGRSWTWSNINEHLKDVTWQESITQVSDLNTIAVLTFHINFYVEAMLKVFDNKPFDSHDKFAFDVPDIHSKRDWGKVRDKLFREADRLEKILRTFPDKKLDAIFVEKKYGTYFRQFQGIIEHSFYHLGQIVILKKIIRAGKTK